MKADERIHKSFNQPYMLGYFFFDTVDLLQWKENSEDQEDSRTVGFDMYTPRDGPPRLHKPFTFLFPSCTPPSRPTTHLITHAFSDLPSAIHAPSSCHTSLLSSSRRLLTVYAKCIYLRCSRLPTAFALPRYDNASPARSGQATI